MIIYQSCIDSSFSPEKKEDYAATGAVSFPSKCEGPFTSEWNGHRPGAGVRGVSGSRTRISMKILLRFTIKLYRRDTIHSASQSISITSCCIEIPANFGDHSHAD